MDGTGIRTVSIADLDTVMVLNEAAVPSVNRVSMDLLKKFVQQAAYFRVVTSGDAVVAFLVGFSPGADYGSENYRWFRRRYQEFFYIDRVAVAPEHRGKKHALALYRDIERLAMAPMLACEVNLQPRNERSLEFHRLFGFRQVGTQTTEGGAKTVSLMVKPLAVSIA